MAHNLTKNAKTGQYEMAYVGEKPWHGLGQEVEKGCSIDEMRLKANLMWEAIPTTAQYLDMDGKLLAYEGKTVLYRSDTRAPVGMVTPDYRIFQPADCLEVFRALVEKADSGWYIHTAGSLRGGSKIWAMATNDTIGGRASVGKIDRLRPNLLCATSLDGSMKTKIKEVGTRVVCENTVNIALREDGSEVVLSHRGQLDVDDMVHSLQNAAYSFSEFVEAANAMAERMVGTEEAVHILRSLFGQPTNKEIKPSQEDFAFQRLMSQFVTGDNTKLREQRSVARCLDLFNGEAIGASLPGSKDTAWGLLNAVTQHIDHERGRTPDTRMESAWFGEGERIKGEAMEALGAAA